MDKDVGVLRTHKEPSDVTENACTKSGWRSAETAPKNGDAFIGLVKGLAMQVHWQMYYVKWPHEEGGPTYRGGWSAETWDGHIPCDLSGWMPLPDGTPGDAVSADGGESLCAPSLNKSNPAASGGAE